MKIKSLRFAVLCLTSVVFMGGAVASPADADEVEDAKIDSPVETMEAMEEVLQQQPAVESEVERSASADPEIEANTESETVVAVETDQRSVSLPRDPNTPVEIADEGENPVSLELPGSASEADVQSDGSVVYEDAAADTDLVLQAQSQGGVRVFAVIDGTEAPTEYRFTVDLPESKALMFNDTTGEAGIYDSDSMTIETVPAPWAYDADGNEIPSRYSLTGEGTLILHVDHEAASTYPVVADPCWSCAKDAVVKGGKAVGRGAKAVAKPAGKYGLKATKFAVKKAGPVGVALCAGGAAHGYWRSNSHGVGGRLVDAGAGCLF